MTGILNLPGLRELDRKELEDEYHVKAEPAAISRLCPHCGELHRVQRHGIRQTLARYETALNVADTATIVDLYTKDGIQMAPDAPAAVGAEGIKAAYEGTFKAISLKLKFTVDEVKVLSKTSALLRSHSAGTLKVNGTDQPAGPAAFKELFILNKQANGQWKFSHYSFSTAPVAK